MVKAVSFEREQNDSQGFNVPISQYPKYQQKEKRCAISYEQNAINTSPALLPGLWQDYNFYFWYNNLAV